MIPMHLQSLARKPVIADLLATFGGRVIQMLFALVGSIVCARALGPADLGRFGLVMATVTICGTFADAGLTYTTVKFIAQYNTKDPSRAHVTARIYLALRLCTGTAIAILGVALSAPIATYLLGQPDLTAYLQLAFATLTALSISSYPGTVLTGLAQFTRLSVASILNAIITLSGILLLLLIGHLNLTTLIAWNVILPIISTLPAWVLLPVGWFPWKNVKEKMEGGGQSQLRFTLHASRSILQEMLNFSKWMWVSNVGAIIAAQGDILLLGRLAGPASVGVYSVALALAFRLDALNQSLFTVMMPRASRLQDSNDINQYTRRTLAGSLTLACFLGVAAILAQPLITIFYGERFVASAGLFLALTVVVLFDLITSSIFLVALPLNKSRVLAASDGLRVVVLCIAAWLLIPINGGYGAVAARFLSRISGAAYTFYALRHVLRGRGRVRE